MKRILVWDLPVRLFHWMLAASFIVAFVIALFISHRNPLFPIHMLLGGVAAFMVVLRLIWGFVGTRWVRFDQFLLSPKHLLTYLHGIYRRSEPNYVGHNPGSSIAAVVMFTCIIGLAITGIAMGNDGPEAFEEVHELLAWIMAGTVVVHLIGIAWFSLRRNENIAKSMIDGRKETLETYAISNTRPAYGVVFLALTLLWTAGLVTGFDSQARQVSLPVVGKVMQLGHGPASEQGAAAAEPGDDDHNDHDDHEEEHD